MNRFITFSNGVMVFLSLALCLSLATWWSSRQELQAITAANGSVRKTLGEMTIAMAEKDKQIDRLSALPCGAGTTPQAGSGSPRRAVRP